MPIVISSPETVAVYGARRSVAAARHERVTGTAPDDGRPALTLL
jgi:hypothetical protein